jgi:quercetin dioxygenase-like cupin family protein
MRNLAIGLVIGAVLGAVSVSLLAQQRSLESYPDSVTADPKHYSVSFENDVARFIRVRYGPGEKSPMHRHLPGCVVYLTDQTMNFTVPDGSGGKETVEAGALGCGDGNVHASENLEGAAEFIIVEFKDRKTFRSK